MKIANGIDRPMNSLYVEGIRVGKSSILDSIYEHFFPKIRRFIIQHSGTSEDAKDIFQEALLVIYNNALSKDFKLTCAFGTYLYAICRNIWFYQIRRKKIQIKVHEEEDTLVDPEELEDSLIWLERYKIYQRQFQNISDQCQALLQAYLSGEDMLSIAKQFGFASVAYARKRKFKCKEQLILKIEEDEDFKKLPTND